MKQILFHGGPLAGQRHPSHDLPSEARTQGRWRMHYVAASGRSYRGRYVRDEGSAGGRDWDWEEE